MEFVLFASVAGEAGCDEVVEVVCAAVVFWCDVVGGGGFVAAVGAGVLVAGEALVAEVVPACAA